MLKFHLGVMVVVEGGFVLDIRVEAKGAEVRVLDSEESQRLYLWGVLKLLTSGWTLGFSSLKRYELAGVGKEEENVFYSSSSISLPSTRKRGNRVCLDEPQTESPLSAWNSCTGAAFGPPGSVARTGVWFRLEESHAGGSDPPRRIARERILVRLGVSHAAKSRSALPSLSLAESDARSTLKSSDSISLGYLGRTHEHSEETQGALLLSLSRSGMDEPGPGEENAGLPSYHLRLLHLPRRGHSHSNFCLGNSGVKAVCLSSDFRILGKVGAYVPTTRVGGIAQKVRTYRTLLVGGLEAFDFWMDIRLQMRGFLTTFKLQEVEKKYAILSCKLLKFFEYLALKEGALSNATNSPELEKKKKMSSTAGILVSKGLDGSSISLPSTRKRGNRVCLDEPHSAIWDGRTSTGKKRKELSFSRFLALGWTNQDRGRKMPGYPLITFVFSICRDEATPTRFYRYPCCPTQVPGAGHQLVSCNGRLPFRSQKCKILNFLKQDENQPLLLQEIHLQAQNNPLILPTLSTCRNNLATLSLLNGYSLFIFSLKKGKVLLGVTVAAENIEFQNRIPLRIRCATVTGSEVLAIFCGVSWRIKLLTSWPPSAQLPSLLPVLIRDYGKLSRLRIRQEGTSSKDVKAFSDLFKNPTSQRRRGSDGVTHAKRRDIDVYAKRRDSTQLVGQCRHSTRAGRAADAGEPFFWSFLGPLMYYKPSIVIYGQIALNANLLPLYIGKHKVSQQPPRLHVNQKKGEGGKPTANTRAQKNPRDNPPASHKKPRATVQQGTEEPTQSREAQEPNRQPPSRKATPSTGNRRANRKPGRGFGSRGGQQRHQRATHHGEFDQASRALPACGSDQSSCEDFGLYKIPNSSYDTLNWYQSKVFEEMATNKVDALEGEVDQIKSEIDKFSTIEEKFSTMDRRFSSMENQFGRMEEIIRKLMEI
ncbi:hypothetical protein M5K25_003783 [Dendrobium thyrsiflorum]|uniref:Uncharacterized protein n=1 Tax=Dendrobium thyrsiflorum TaxID=117978 RepID=A0ABD0VRU7_DENTH